MKSHKKRIADIRNYLQPLKNMVDSVGEEVLYSTQGWQDADEGLQKTLQELDALEQDLDKKE